MRTPGTSWESKVYQQLRHVSRTTISIWNAARSGRLPITIAQKDFGADTVDHMLAIQWCIDNKRILPDDLEDAKNSGSKMNVLILLSDNPYKVKFVTINELI